MKKEHNWKYIPNGTNAFCDDCGYFPGPPILRKNARGCKKTKNTLVNLKKLVSDYTFTHIRYTRRFEMSYGGETWLPIPEEYLE